MCNGHTFKVRTSIIEPKWIVVCTDCMDNTNGDTSKMTFGTWGLWQESN